MEIQFKSSDYNEDKFVRTFNKNFKTSSIIEEEHLSLKNNINGTVKEIHINNSYVLYQDYTNKNHESYTLEIHLNKPTFLLQFIIEGEGKLSTHEKTSLIFNLKKSTYNLFYSPASKYVYKYIKSKKKTLNIYFTASFLNNKLGKSFLKRFKNYIQAKKEHQLCTTKKRFHI